jgi:uncharacterized protein
MEENNKEINNKPNTFKKVISIIVILIILFLAYVRFVGTSGLIVKEYPVKSDNIPESFNGLKIIQLSDIHYNSISKEILENVVNEINKNKPDIVVFTGDLYDSSSILSEDAISDIENTLSGIKTTIGKYAVSGNHDYSLNNYEEIITKSGFTYLENDSKIIYYKGNTPIEIIGYPSLLNGTPNYDYALSDYYKIVLMHEPDAIKNLEDKNIDLVLAGHSHGGQVRLPFIGPIIKPAGAKTYYNEYYQVNNTKLYINYGIGTVDAPFRFFDRPSINLYRLYKKTN